MDKLIRCAIVLLGLHISGVIKGQHITVMENGSNNDFSLAVPGKKTVVLMDSADYEVVKISGNLLVRDIERVSGNRPVITDKLGQYDEYLVIIGAVEKSRWIKQLIRAGNINIHKIENQWERFIIKNISTPFPGVKQALVIAGSDRRGTAYGVFELSKAIGVSPWYWWADVPVTKRKSIYVHALDYTSESPSVKYRGIFLNDEDWGLKPWAAGKMDTDIKDIGPKTYAKIFELLLRLKANFIWPAMHECTKAFYFYPGNPETAEKYAIVVGSSHCEPLLRNNVFEWVHNFEHEYGRKPGEWRYDRNKEEIYTYWNDRVNQSKHYESVYTIGMRGVHDGRMPGPDAREEKLKLLEQVINDQRSILTNNIQKKISDIPQIFCPYKEVLQLYQAGLKLPDDVTIVWADDNHGYIRQLSNPDEQKRPGGSGIYYHLSYWGAPHDYLWLSSISPSLISFELSKAYALGASRLWVINVGDIKPAEAEIQFAMDLAYDIHQWKPATAYSYTEAWASSIFGDEWAKPVAHIKNEYYRLAQCGKPEHLGVLVFDDTTSDGRLAEYISLANEAEMIKTYIPEKQQDAYFQLVYYPVMATAQMNRKILFARKSLRRAAKGDSSAMIYAQRAKDAFEKIKELTNMYNEIAGGKWQGIMTWNPRKLDVFDMPMIATKDMIGKPWPSDAMASIKGKKTIEMIPASSASLDVKRDGKIILDPSDYSVKHTAKKQNIEVIKGLGIGGNGVTLMPFTCASTDEKDIKKASYIELYANLTKGAKTITVKCLPTRSCYPGRKLRYAISVNNKEPEIADMDIPGEDKTWVASVLRGYSVGITKHLIEDTQVTNIRLYFLDPGLVINSVEIE